MSIPADDLQARKTANRFERRQWRRFLWVLLYLIVAAPWLVRGALESMQTTANSPVDWVDDSFQPRRVYDRFVESFAAGDVVVLSWEGLQLGDSDLDQLANELRTDPAFYAEDTWLFSDIVTGTEALAELTTTPASLTRDEAISELVGTLIGGDKQTTCMVIGFTGPALLARREIVPLIKERTRLIANVIDSEIHMAGPIIDGYEVDLASQQTMDRIAPISSAVVFVLCYFCLRSIVAAIVVFGVSLLCQLAALAIVHYSGHDMTALLIVLPPLVQVLAIAGGLHLVHYYQHAKAAPGASRFEAAAQAFHVGWSPCILSSVTTAFGLGSLLTSGLVSVREFGGLSAVAVLVTTTFLLMLIPGLLSWVARVPGAKSDESQELGPHISPAWIRLTQFVHRYASILVVLMTALIVGLGVGVAELKASVRIETLFGQHSRLMTDYRWLEDQIGPLVPIEVLVRFDQPSPATSLLTLDQVQTLRDIEAALRSHDVVSAVSSCLDSVPDDLSSLPTPMANELLTTLTPQLEERGYAATDGNNIRLWRMTGHVSALDGIDYSDVLHDLQTNLNQIAASSSTRPATVELSGLMPLVDEIQSRLLSDLFISFVTAFGLIAVLMIIVLAGLRPALIAMLPNVFPALVLFGMLGWIGHPIDIGTIMTASVAMGIGVDDTLHFLSSFQRHLDTGLNRSRAVLATYQQCGTAILQTTIICGLGLAVFGFSDFLPTARFAWMMLALLSAAVIGDLILLPAFILSPFGRTFQSSKDELEGEPPTNELNSPVNRISQAV